MRSLILYIEDLKLIMRYFVADETNRATFEDELEKISNFRFNREYAAFTSAISSGNILTIAWDENTNLLATRFQRAPAPRN